MISPRSRRFAAFLVLFALPLLLRVASIDHGGERNYIPDTHIVRAALGMARDHDFLPPPGKYSAYPNLLPYLLMPIYAAQMVAGRITGAWSSVAEFGQHMLAHPQHAAWPARILIALFGALTPWIVWRAARAAGLTRGAWIAAWLAGTGLLALQFSTEERPWVPVVFFMCASAWAAIEYAREPTLRKLVLSGAMAGFALAAHTSGAGALAIPALAWLCAPAGWNSADLRKRLGHGFAAVAAFVLVALFTGHAYMLKHGWTPPEQAIGGAKIDENNGFNIGGVSFVPQMRWSSVERLSKALVGYDPVVLLLGIAGIWLALRERRLRAIALFVLVWTAIFLPNKSDHVRYLLPVTVLLALPAGLVAEKMLQRRWGLSVLAILLAFPLVQAVRFDVVLGREDTRAIAERRLAELPQAARVAVDRYGPQVDLDRNAIYALAMLRNTLHEPLRSREEFRKREIDSGTAADPGVNAVMIEELFEYDPAEGISVRHGLEPLGRDPRAVLRTLGVTHYLRVDRRPRDAQKDLVFGGEVPGRRVWVIDPAGAGGPPGEAFLPTEMDFPLTGLWSVERPGPWLELTDLR
jgi:hypothetical protein